VGKVVASFMDWSSPHLEHSFSILCTNKDFVSRLIGSQMTALEQGHCVGQGHYVRVTTNRWPFSRFGNFNTNLDITLVVDAAGCCICLRQTLCVHSPDGSTFEHKLTSWVPYWTQYIISKIGLCQSSIFTCRTVVVTQWRTLEFLIPETCTSFLSMCCAFLHKFFPMQETSTE